MYWEVPEWTDRRQSPVAAPISSTPREQEIPRAVHRAWEGELLVVYTIFTNEVVSARDLEARLADPLVEPLLHELPAAADAPVYEAATGASASNTNESGGAGAGASLARADGAPANAAANEPPQLPAEVSAVSAAEAVDDGDAADAA